MKTKHVLLCALSLLFVGAQACVTEDESNAEDVIDRADTSDSTNTTDSTSSGADIPTSGDSSGGSTSSGSDTSGSTSGVDISGGEDTSTSGDSSGGIDTTDTGEDFLRYYFVRINDQSVSTGANPGADLDAVSIQKPDGSTYYAAKVEDYSPVNVEDISLVSAIPDNILGAPTAFGSPFDPDQVGIDHDCSLSDENYVSLGGVGGYIIVSFGSGHVEDGDLVAVYEIGNCANGGIADPVEVQVSVSASADSNWVTIYSAVAGPRMIGTVSALPKIPAD